MVQVVRENDRLKVGAFIPLHGIYSEAVRMV